MKDDDGEQEFNEVTDPEVTTRRNLYGKQPAYVVLSREVDATNTNIDEQGFQLVTSKSTKRTEKKANTQNTSKSKPYITRSKVRFPKPFK